MYDYELLNKIRLGRRIAEARVSKDLTQVSLAMLLFYKQSEIGKYETGKRIPRDQAIEHIADKLDVDPVWLKYGDKSTFEIKETEYGQEVLLRHFNTDKTKKKSLNEIEELLGKLSTEDLSILVEMANFLYLNENPKLLSETLAQEESDYKAKIEGIKKYNEDNQPFYKALSFASEIGLMKELYPDLVDELLVMLEKNRKKYKSPDKVSDADLEVWKEINKKAQVRAWKENPDLEEKFFENFISKEKMTQKDRVQNRKLLRNVIIPELMKRKVEKNKYQRKLMKVSK